MIERALVALERQKSVLGPHEDMLTGLTAEPA